ncbi:single-stranded-DNA-specific exonuclease RecJ [Chloroflexi bacterium TSY]|nr:single-stranded-DNA-specific exonuclease RecJ [Chloroflexi bacterium TSY]
MQAKNWSIYPAAPQEFLDAIPEHPVLVQVLYNRGMRSADEVKTFLVSNDAVRENPYRLRDMAPAVARILKAIEQKETICVYGDFDADGVTATALLTSALQAAGGRVGPYIPDRVDEGYGLNLDAVERIAAKALLMVTVDCGIRSVAEVAHAVQFGMDVIVTDHHSVGPELPEAVAVINPRRADCTSNFERLAGVGVAYRLSQAVLRAVAQQPWSKIDEERVRELETELLDFVAIGTVADMMPLLGENRSLVQRGLAQLNRTQRPGLQTLMSHADMRPGTVDAAAISFRLAPRLNAAGRLSQTQLAYRLLRTNEPTEAYNLTIQLEGLNQQRRDLTAAAQTEAEQIIAEQADNERSIYVVSSPRFQSGIVGLVAGRLTDQFYRPFVVIEQGEEESKGSARSIDEFNISDALDEVSGHLVRHGGHAAAAGFTVRTEQMPAFIDALESVADRELSSHQNLRPTLEIDAEISLDAINWGLQKQFARLEPTGQENSQPLLLCKQCRVREMRLVGDRKHLRLILDNGPSSHVFDAIAFRQSDWSKSLQEGSHIDIACYVEANEWQGRQRLQLNVQDMRLSESQ